MCNPVNNIDTLPNLEGEEALYELKAMGLNIDDDKEALEYIKTFTFKVIAFHIGNYFKDASGKFYPRTNLKWILRIINIDLELRSALTLVLSIFEDWLGFAITSHIENRYGDSPFEDKQNFINHHELKRVLKYMAVESSDIYGNVQTTYPLSQIQRLSFGSKITLLLCIKPHVRRKLLVNVRSILGSANFDLFRDYKNLRNHCCHLKPIFNDVENKYIIPSDKPYFNPEYSLLFNIILSLNMFVPALEMKGLTNKLSSIFMYAEHDLLKNFGFPPNWEDILRKEVDKYANK